MAKKTGSGTAGSAPKQSSSRKGVVDLADARVRLSSRSPQPQQSQASIAARQCSLYVLFIVNIGGR